MNENSMSKHEIHLKYRFYVIIMKPLFMAIRIRLEQVIRNLLTNALNFTTDGSVILSLLRR